MFIDQLVQEIKTRKTPCIVGLDPAVPLMPPDFLATHGISATSSRQALADALFDYAALVLEAVADLVPAVKPQSAYFERYGAPGIVALEKTITRAKELGLLVILDVKRGDIGSTAEAYAQGYLGEPRGGGPAIDCVTLNPYLGADSLEPFLTVCEETGKGVFVCVKTSNPGSAALQDLKVDGRMICEVVAGFLRPWSDKLVGKSGYSGIGAVVGATYAETASLIRRQLPRSFLLVPGIGAQGGDTKTLRRYFNEDGLGAVISSSRAINFPHRYGADKRSGKEAIRKELVAMIETVRAALA